VTRAEIAARVDELADRRETFVSEVRRFAGELDRRERELLGEILLTRAKEDGAFAEALRGRARARGWLRRQWDRSGGGDRRNRTAR
jgi:alkylation response protein AidB-like acyl-CoA dehydrogenase